MSKRDETDTTMTLDGFLRDVPQSLPEDIDFEDDGDESVRSVLARVCLDEAMDRAANAATARPGPLVMMVTTPSPAWNDPVRQEMARRCRWDDVYGPTVGRKSAVSEIFDRGRNASDAISRGGKVLGVSHSPATNLPTSLIAAADVSVNRTPSRRRCA